MIDRILVVFCKDLRRLWPIALLLWATIVSMPSMISENGSGVFWGVGVQLAVPFLLVPACWLLVVILIQQEGLVGAERYWLSRPFAWQELVMAKTLFVASLIGLPLWTCSRVLWHNPMLGPSNILVYVVLPAAAFAAVTSNLGQAILSFVGAVVGSFLFIALAEPASEPRPNFADLFAAAVAIAVVLLQYSRRREILARSILLAGVIVWVAWIRLR